MKYGPRKTKELAAQAVKLQSDTGMAWSDVAKQLGVTYPWLMWHTPAAGRVVGDRKGPTLRVATAAHVERARELRERKVCWKVIGRELGLDNTESLRRALYLYLRQHPEINEGHGQP